MEPSGQLGTGLGMGRGKWFGQSGQGASVSPKAGGRGGDLFLGLRLFGRCERFVFPPGFAGDLELWLPLLELCGHSVHPDLG